MDNNEFVAMIKDLKELREIRDAAKDLVRARKAELLSDDELEAEIDQLTARLRQERQDDNRKERE